MLGFANWISRKATIARILNLHFDSLYCCFACNLRSEQELRLLILGYPRFFFKSHLFNNFSSTGPIWRRKAYHLKNTLIYMYMDGPAWEHKKWQLQLTHAFRAALIGRTVDHVRGAPLQVFGVTGDTWTSRLPIDAQTVHTVLYSERWNHWIESLPVFVHKISQNTCCKKWRYILNSFTILYIRGRQLNSFKTVNIVISLPTKYW